MKDYIPIKPWAEKSGSMFCNCDLCHKVGPVVKLYYQKTGYWKQPNGTRPLSQKKYEIWMCDDCRNKIIDCLVSKVKKEV